MFNHLWHLFMAQMIVAKLVSEVIRLDGFPKSIISKCPTTRNFEGIVQTMEFSVMSFFLLLSLSQKKKKKKKKVYSIVVVFLVLFGGLIAYFE